MFFRIFLKYFSISTIFYFLISSAYAAPGKEDELKDQCEKRKIDNEETTPIKKNCLKRTSVSQPLYRLNFDSSFKGNFFLTDIMPTASSCSSVIRTPHEPHFEKRNQEDIGLSNYQSDKSLIEKIPLEILSKIFDYLPFRSILNLSQTSANLRPTLSLIKKVRLKKIFGCQERLNFFAAKCPNLTSLKIDICADASKQNFVKEDVCSNIIILQDRILMKLALLIENGWFKKLQNFKYYALSLDENSAEIIIHALGKNLLNPLKKLKLCSGFMTQENEQRLKKIFDCARIYPNLQSLNSFSFEKSQMNLSDFHTLNTTLQSPIFSSLVSLKLNHNSFTLMSMIYLTEGLHYGKHSIATLSLLHCNLSEEMGVVFAECLEKNAVPLISTLRLGHNFLGPKFAIAFAKALEKKHLTQLKNIELEHNFFGDKGMNEITQALIKSECQLETCDFTFCRQSKQSIKFFFNYFNQSNSNKIKSFKINNSLERIGLGLMLAQIFQTFSFGNLTEIVYFDINPDIKETESFFAIMTDGHVPQLKKLKLEFLQLSIPHANIIAACINNNGFKNLTELDLSHNRIKNKVLSIITDAMNKRNLINLKTLKLSDNFIHNLGLFELLSTFHKSNYSKLTYLDLSSNKINANGLIEISRLIFDNRLPNLETLLIDISLSQTSVIKAFETCLLHGHLNHLVNFPIPLKKPRR